MAKLMNVLPGILYAFENCLAASGRQIYRAIKVQNKKKKLKNLCSVRRSWFVSPCSWLAV